MPEDADLSGIDPFIGEVALFAGDFAPRGWAFAEGQLLSTQGNDALFALLNTTYGGDGVNTFALPDLRGRSAVHPGNGILRGQTFGRESLVLTADTLPAHTHALPDAQVVPLPAGLVLLGTAIALTAARRRRIIR